MILAVLPVACLGLMWLLAAGMPAARRGPRPPGITAEDSGSRVPGERADRAGWRRHALVDASLAWGVLLVAMTELLGLFHALTRVWVAGVWGAAALLLALAAARRVKDGRLQLGELWPVSGRGPLVVACVLACAAIAVVVGFIALVAPPNTWDSMTYHMARIMHWQQDRSVAFYPSDIQRQLHLTPGAEFVVLHFHLLAGGDRLDNLVQWLAMCGSVALVSLVAAQLGAASRGQALSAVFCATLPMGILQASSTQTDYVVSYWLVCLVVLVLRAGARATWSWELPLALGAAAGLAMLTKATAYLFAAPFALWLFLRLVRERNGLARTAGFIAVVAALALALNVGQFGRNLHLYGSPMGPDGDGPAFELKYLNAIISAPEFASNVVRNAALHVGTPSQRLNQPVQNVLVRFHQLLGIDPSDPRTTYGGTIFAVRQTSNGEDTAGNPVHFALIVVALAAIAVVPRYRRRPIVAYAVCLVGGFLLFALLLRWQPFGSRLQLPLFVLAAPLVGLLAGELPGRVPGVVLAVGLTLASMPWLVANRSRPLLGSNPTLQTSPSILHTPPLDQYFVKQPQLEGPYRAAAALVTERGARRVGLVLHENDWEYPFWVLLRPGTRSWPQIEHAEVGTPSERLGAGGPFDAVVCVACEPGSRRELLGNGYVEASAGPIVDVFFPRGTPAKSS